MHTPTRNKQNPSTQSKEKQRNFQSAQSGKATFTSNYPRENSTHRRNISKRLSFSVNESHSLLNSSQKSFMGDSPEFYKSKRPQEITDTLETEKPVSVNGRTPNSYDIPYTKSYTVSASPNNSILKVPFMTSRSGIEKAEERTSAMEFELSNKESRSSNVKNTNNTSYIVEKVYSMKLNGGGLLGSLVPLSKSRTPVAGSSSKPAILNHSKSDIRENDLNTTPVTSPKRYQTQEFFSQKRNNVTVMKNGMVPQQRPPFNSQKSLGKLVNDGKGSNSTQKEANKKDTSPIAKKNIQGKTLQKDKSPGTGKSSYSTGSNFNEKTKGLRIEALKGNCEKFAKRLTELFWHVRQRNKRISFLNLFEFTQNPSNKVPEYFRRKDLLLKSKYFCMWQEFLLGVNRERQEQVEVKKLSLAGEFYNRKILRKCFHTLQSPPNSLNELPQPITTTPKSQTSRQNSVPQLKATGFQGRSSTNIAPNKTQTRAFNSYQSVNSKSRPIPSKEKMSPEKNFIRPEKQPVPPKLYSPIGNRSKSAGKVLKEANSTPNSVSRVTMTGRGKVPNIRIQKPMTAACSPTNKHKTVDYTRFGKSVTHINDHSESEEMTLNSQNVLKTPKNKEQDHSFGYKNANNSFEKCEEAFESILTEIHQPPDFAQEPLLLANLKPLPTDTRRSSANTNRSSNENAKKGISAIPAKKSNKPVVKTNFQAKTTRNYSIPTKVNKHGTRDTSLTSRSRQDDSRIKVDSTKKVNLTVSSYKTTKTNASIVRSKNELDEENDEIASYKLEKAIQHRRKFLLQNCFVWFLASSMQTREELIENTEKADSHYEIGLKIKGISGIIKNYVKSIKENQLYKEHNENYLMKSCFSAWSDLVPQLKEENKESDSAYDNIVARFRFIVLTEKVMRQLKEMVFEKKIKTRVPKGKGKGY